MTKQTEVTIQIYHMGFNEQGYRIGLMTNEWQQYSCIVKPTKEEAVKEVNSILDDLKAFFLTQGIEWKINNNGTIKDKIPLEWKITRNNDLIILEGKYFKWFLNPPYPET